MTVSRLATVFLTLVSAVVTFYLDSIAGAWKLLLVTGAGTGGVLLLRWYWWRINAWSEVSAMLTAFVVSVGLQVGFGLDTDKPLDFAWLMITTVAITTAVWLAVTFLTAPEKTDVLVAFYRRTRPSKTGWAPIAALAPEVKPSRDGLSNLLCWAGGCMLIYGALFGVGKLLLHETDYRTGAAGDGSDRVRRHLSQSFAEGLECSCGLSAAVLFLAAVSARAAGPVDFGKAELDAALAARKHKLRVDTELNLDPPETFRITLYKTGVARITGGDLRGLMYGLIEAADQIRATGRLKSVSGKPATEVRGVRMALRSADLAEPWFTSDDRWRAYFQTLARSRLNRFSLVLPLAEADIERLRMLSETASEFGVDFVLGIRHLAGDPQELYARLRGILDNCPLDPRRTGRGRR